MMSVGVCADPMWRFVPVPIDVRRLIDRPILFLKVFRTAHQQQGTGRNMDTIALKVGCWTLDPVLSFDRWSEADASQLRSFFHSFLMYAPISESREFMNHRRHEVVISFLPP